MQFRLTNNKAILTLLSMPLLLLSAAETEQPASCSAKMAMSPNGAYEVCWVDVMTSPHLQQQRFIFAVERGSTQLLFNHSTLQRYTGARWNSSSTACAIFDAPDNANVYVWILRKLVNSNTDRWATNQVDLHKLVADKVPGVFTDGTTRTGLEKIAWQTDDVLKIELIINNHPVGLEIPAEVRQ